MNNRTISFILAAACLSSGLAYSQEETVDLKSEFLFVKKLRARRYYDVADYTYDRLRRVKLSAAERQRVLDDQIANLRDWARQDRARANSLNDKLRSLLKELARPVAPVTGTFAEQMSAFEQQFKTAGKLARLAKAQTDEARKTADIVAASQVFNPLAQGLMKLHAKQAQERYQLDHATPWTQEEVVRLEKRSAQLDDEALQVDLWLGTVLHNFAGLFERRESPNEKQNRKTLLLEAQKATRRVLEFNDDILSAQQLLGRILLDLGKYREAPKPFEYVLKESKGIKQLKPLRQEAYYYLARAHRFRKAFADGVKTIRAHRREFSQGRFGAHLRWLEAQCHEEWGDALRTDKQPEAKWKAQYERARTIAQELADANIFKALASEMILRLGKKIGGAVSVNAGALLFKGEQLMAKKEYLEAAPFLQRAFEAGLGTEGQFRALYNLGRCFYERKLHYEAAICYRTAAETNPEHKFALSAAMLAAKAFQDSAKLTKSSFERQAHLDYLRWAQTHLGKGTGDVDYQQGIFHLKNQEYVKAREFLRRVESTSRFYFQAVYRAADCSYRHYQTLSRSRTAGPAQIVRAYRTTFADHQQFVNLARQRPPKEEQPRRLYCSAVYQLAKLCLERGAIEQQLKTTARAYRRRRLDAGSAANQLLAHLRLVAKQTDQALPKEIDRPTLARAPSQWEAAFRLLWKPRTEWMIKLTDTFQKDFPKRADRYAAVAVLRMSAFSFLNQPDRAAQEIKVVEQYPSRQIKLAEVRRFLLGTYETAAYRLEQAAADRKRPEPIRKRAQEKADEYRRKALLLRFASQPAADPKQYETHTDSLALAVVLFQKKDDLLLAAAFAEAAAEKMKDQAAAARRARSLHADLLLKLGSFEPKYYQDAIAFLERTDKGYEDEFQKRRAQTDRAKRHDADLNNKIKLLECLLGLKQDQHLARCRELALAVWGEFQAGSETWWEMEGAFCEIFARQKEYRKARERIQLNFLQRPTLGDPARRARFLDLLKRIAAASPAEAKACNELAQNIRNWKK